LGKAVDFFSPLGNEIYLYAKKQQFNVPVQQDSEIPFRAHDYIMD
jgi:hypothetical protein